MAYPNYGYNSYGYVPNYAPGYVAGSECSAYGPAFSECSNADSY